MELKEFRKKEYLLKINRSEALDIIESLSRQVRTNDPNTNRPEYMGIKGAKYFTIIVLEPGPEVALRERVKELELTISNLDNWPKFHPKFPAKKRRKLYGREREPVGRVR